MEQYADVIIDPQGNVVVGAMVSILDSQGAPAQIFGSNNQNSSINNPILTGSLGEFSFFARNGRYRIGNISVGGRVFQAGYREILLYDPTDDVGGIPVRVDRLESSVEQLDIETDAATQALDALQLPDYAALRAYKGPRKSVYVTGVLGTAAPSGVAGMFVRREVAGAVDNGGTRIVGQYVWDRVFDGDLSLHWFGVKGDGVANDITAIQTALNVAALAGGGVVRGFADKTYRVTSGITITTQDVILDLGGGALFADFDSGWAVTVGDGVAVTRNIGVRNGYIYTNRPSTALNGVRFHKNARYQIAYENLRIESFKGTGMHFEELNWSIQGPVAPMIRFCGTGMVIEENGNAILLAGCSLDDSDDYNLILRGAISITVVGGYNQFAGIAGILIDNGTKTTLQASWAISCYGVYFEGNGQNHINARNGRGLVVDGCIMNCNNMTAAAIKLSNWAGASITGNTPANLSAGTQRDFVEADATCTLVDVGVQHVTTQNDAFVCTQGGSIAGIVGARQKRFAFLPTPNPLTVGSTVMLTGTGTEADRAMPHMAVQVASGNFVYRRLEMRPVKQIAVNPGATFTPLLDSYGVFDLTVSATGLTINAPSGQVADGDEITFLLRQTPTGGGAVTWNAAYATDLTSAGNTASTFASVTFRWSAGRSRWVQTGKLLWTA